MHRIDQRARVRHGKVSLRRIGRTADAQQEFRLRCAEAIGEDRHLAMFGVGDLIGEDRAGQAVEPFGGRVDPADLPAGDRTIAERQRGILYRIGVRQIVRNRSRIVRQSRGGPSRLHERLRNLRDIAVRLHRSPSHVIRRYRIDMGNRCHWQASQASSREKSRPVRRCSGRRGGGDRRAHLGVGGDGGRHEVTGRDQRVDHRRDVLFPRDRRSVSAAGSTIAVSVRARAIRNATQPPSARTTWAGMRPACRLATNVSPRR